MTLKVKVIGKINGTTESHDLTKLDLDTKIVILNVLVLKLWSKTSFYKMVTNITCSSMSQVQTIQEIYNLLKAFTQVALC